LVYIRGTTLFCVFSFCQPLPHPLPSKSPRRESSLFGSIYAHPVLILSSMMAMVHACLASGRAVLLHFHCRIALVPCIIPPQCILNSIYLFFRYRDILKWSQVRDNCVFAHRIVVNRGRRQMNQYQLLWLECGNMI